MELDPGGGGGAVLGPDLICSNKSEQYSRNRCDYALLFSCFSRKITLETQTLESPPAQKRPQNKKKQ
eukprot:257740-Amphidinium_carterae.1